MTTHWADEAARPSQPFQVVQAVCISREPSPKLPKRFRVVAAGTGTFHCPSLRSTPVKWTPQRCHIAAPMINARCGVTDGMGAASRCGRYALSESRGCRRYAIPSLTDDSGTIPKKFPKKLLRTPKASAFLY